MPYVEVNIQVLYCYMKHYLIVFVLRTQKSAIVELCTSYQWYLQVKLLLNMEEIEPVQPSREPMAVVKSD